MAVERQDGRRHLLIWDGGGEQSHRGPREYGVDLGLLCGGFRGSRKPKALIGGGSAELTFFALRLALASDGSGTRRSFCRPPSRQKHLGRVVGTQDD